MRPHVRTRRSMERRGGRDSGKSVNGAMFGVVTRHFVFWPQTAHSSRTGRVHSTSDAICTARRPRMAGVRGARPSKTAKRGANQRTVVPKTWTNCGSGMRCEFLGVNVRFLAREDGCPPPVFSCSPSKKATLECIGISPSLPLTKQRVLAPKRTQDLQRGRWACRGRRSGPERRGIPYSGPPTPSVTAKVDGF